MGLTSTRHAIAMQNPLLHAFYEVNVCLKRDVPQPVEIHWCLKPQKYSDCAQHQLVRACAPASCGLSNGEQALGCGCCAAPARHCECGITMAREPLVKAGSENEDSATVPALVQS
ncbi:hypothetical protein TRVL_09344 [Trypanosoma vivax]|nr:hypothetical protein TRVL_09344 [Trypanosoma vivax]